MWLVESFFCWCLNKLPCCEPKWFSICRSFVVLYSSTFFGHFVSGLPTNGSFQIDNPFMLLLNCSTYQSDLCACSGLSSYTIDNYITHLEDYRYEPSTSEVHQICKYGASNLTPINPHPAFSLQAQSLTNIIHTQPSDQFRAFNLDAEEKDSQVQRDHLHSYQHIP